MRGVEWGLGEAEVYEGEKGAGEKEGGAKRSACWTADFWLILYIEGKKV